VPAVIDAAYVNRVLAGLDAANGDIYRTVISTRSITPELVDRIKALTATNAQFDLALKVLQQEARDGFAAFLPNPGNDRTSVSELITADSLCIFAKVDRDSTAVVRTTALNFPQWVALRRLDPPRLNLAYNPTGWGFIYNGVESTLQRPSKNPCTAT